MTTDEGTSESTVCHCTQPLPKEPASQEKQQPQSVAGTLSLSMQVERTTTPDGRLLLLYTFEEPDE